MCPPDKVDIEILKVLNQISKSITLGPVIRILLKIAKPGIPFPPMNVLDRLH